MRDGSRRVRDKFDISLEPRQVALLFVLCLVILILVFALGIIVGRGLKNPVGVPTSAQVLTEAEQPPIDTAVSEQAADAPVENEAPTLKFFAEGEQKPQREVSAIPPPPVVPGQSREAEAPVAAPESTPEAAPAPVAPQAVKAEKESALKPAKVEPKPAQQKIAKKEPAKGADGKFTVQVSAFQNRSQADHLVSNLKNKGYDAYIAKATIPGKGVWYRVRIGKYGTRDAAQSIASTLKRKEGISTYVTLAQ